MVIQGGKERSRGRLTVTEEAGESDMGLGRWQEQPKGQESCCHPTRERTGGPHTVVPARPEERSK
ncbi:mCG1036132 [Mus musculus]|jgi:hypothetical protein|nr:mCG1036132 [Mus musculus]